MLGNPNYIDAEQEFVDALEGESLKESVAATNAFVLLEWASEVIQQSICQRHLWEKHGLELVQQQARILERCLSLEARGSVKHSALVVTRRALRNLFKDPDLGALAVEDTVTQLTSISHGAQLRNAVLLGVVAGVCARLPSRRPILEARKELFYSFYVREIVGSRSPVANHVVAAYNDFFANFTTTDDLQSVVAPALQKALLRAPEVVLNDLVSPMVKSLPAAIDFTELLADRLLKPLLANIKSQNPVIRSGAMSALEACLTHSHDSTYVSKVANDILAPLASSKLSTAEQRTLHARMISLLPFNKDYSESICSSLASVIKKEPNEVALSSESSAFAHHFSLILMSEGETVSTNTESWINTVAQGLSDKRPSIRKVWALRVGDILWLIRNASAQSASALRFVDDVAPRLLKLYDEVTESLQLSVQNSQAAAAYVVVAIYETLVDFVQDDGTKSLLRKSKLHERAFQTDQKTSVLNHRLYTKLSGEEEKAWAIRALGRKQCVEKDILPSTGNSWSLSFLYFITAAENSPPIRKEAVTALRKVYLSRPSVVGRLIIRGLWSWHQQLEESQHDTASAAAKTGNSRVYEAVRCIFPPSNELQPPSCILDKEVLREQLIDILVLAQSEVFPRVNWIKLCLRVRQDPGELVQSNAERIMQILNTIHASMTMKIATYNTAAELAFVSPDTITPLLVTKIQGDLSPERLKSYGPVAIAIAHHSQDNPYIDILSNKNHVSTLDKSSRDYETMKWEQEVRNQLAQKKKQEKKLTADEKAKVDAQMKKEAKIRMEVFELEDRLKRGVGFIRALIAGPPTEASLWLGSCLKALLEIIAVGAGNFLGNVANEVYIACSQLVSSRLGSLRPFIGVATLRNLDSVQLPKSLSEEPLGELVTRVLYRLRFSSEQRPLDSISLMYALPLIFQVLRGGGVGLSPTDDHEEQLTLALEFLCIHAGSFSDRYLPRSDLLELLIISMQQYTQHYRVIKDCLIDSSRACATALSPTEASILLRGTIVPQVSVRGSVLQAIRQEVDLTDLDFAIEIWLASMMTQKRMPYLGKRSGKRTRLSYNRPTRRVFYHTWPALTAS